MNLDKDDNHHIQINKSTLNITKQATKKSHQTAKIKENCKNQRNY